MTTSELDPGRSGFTNVDNTQNPGSYVAYLRELREIDSIKKYKKRAVSLLDTRPGDHVLDVGCGTGEDLLDIFRAQHAGGGLFGVDNSQTMLDIATEVIGLAGIHPTRITLEHGDAHALRFGDNTFDRVRTDRTLQHVKSPSTAIGEMIRVIKQGGRILIIEPDWKSLAVSGLGDKADETIREAFVEIIKNPHIGTDIKEYLVGWPVTAVEEEIFQVNLKDKQEIQKVLWLTSSLTRAAQSRFMDKGKLEEVGRQVEETPNGELSGSFDLHLVRATKV